MSTESEVRGQNSSEVATSGPSAMVTPMGKARNPFSTNDLTWRSLAKGTGKLCKELLSTYDGMQIIFPTKNAPWLGKSTLIELGERSVSSRNERWGWRWN